MLEIVVLDGYRVEGHPSTRTSDSWAEHPDEMEASIGAPASAFAGGSPSVSGDSAMLDDMPSFEDADDGAYTASRVPGRFRVSKQFQTSDPSEPSRRFAYEVYDTDGEVIFDSEHGWEVTLRSTPSRQQMKAGAFPLRFSALDLMSSRSFFAQI